jgi:hypothetical protein
MPDPIRVDQIEPEDVDWLWRDLVARKMIHVVAGWPEQGKGLLTTYIASEVSKAGGNVLISAWEDADGISVRPRLEAAGAKMENCTSWRFMLPIQFGELAELVIEKSIDLIVMDPWSAHAVGKTGDVRELLNPLTQLIEQTGTAVIIVDHALKHPPKGGNVLGVLRGGSSGLPAACRMGFLFGVDPEQPDMRVLCHVKGNVRDKAKPLRFEMDTDMIAVYNPAKAKLVEKPIPYLVFDQELEVFDPMRLFAGGTPQTGPGRPDTKRKAAMEWLTAYLAAALKPVKAGLVIEDAKQAGMAVKTLKNAANEIGVERNPPGGGKNCTWRLSDEAYELMGVEPAKESDNDALDDVAVSFTDADLQKLLDPKQDNDGRKDGE